MNKMISLTTIWILTAGMFCLAADVPQADQKLHVILNKDVVVDSAQICLGQISILTGPKELVEKARYVTIGTFYAKGQVLCADRNTILSRLASTGIGLRQVELSGSETAQVRKNEKYVDPQQIMETARAYIDKHLAGQNVCSLQAIGTLSPVVLNDPNTSAQVSAQMSRYQIGGAKKVTVAIAQDGIPIAQREVTFAVRFWVHRAVAERELLPGTLIRTGDVRIEQVESSVPEPANWKEPFGLVIRRRVAEGSLIHPDWVGPAEAPTLIRRNQQVMVQLSTGAMYLSAPGQALDEGRAGELIRVRRGQRPDERIIYCTIQADGTVRPQI
jgi:flagella basal body P-ring formation protein FlgA